jgi:hypothetical protein
MTVEPGTCSSDEGKIRSRQKFGRKASSKMFNCKTEIGSQVYHMRGWDRDGTSSESCSKENCAITGSTTRQLNFVIFSSCMK